MEVAEPMVNGANSANRELREFTVLTCGGIGEWALGFPAAAIMT